MINYQLVIGHKAYAAKIQFQLSTNKAIFENGEEDGRKCREGNQSGCCGVEKTKEKMLSEHSKNEEATTSWKGWYIIVFPFRQNMILRCSEKSAVYLYGQPNSWLVQSSSQPKIAHHPKDDQGVCQESLQVGARRGFDQSRVLVPEISGTSSYCSSSNHGSPRKKYILRKKYSILSFLHIHSLSS